MFRKFSLFFFLFLSFFKSNSQTPIAGKIVDTSGIGIPYADILLIDEEGNWTNDRTSSDENGYFKLFTNETGKFKISIISIGFEKYESDFFSLILNESVDLQTINLEQESFELNDVDVTARRKIAYRREIDRTIIDLENDSSTSGSTILDILERTPGIVVDRQNESISMLGKSGVNVMINGRITYMPATALIQYLNGMSADNAKAVELITTPPAKFDAEGNSGYINIELKKSENEGISGSLIGTNSYGFIDEYKMQNSVTTNFNFSNTRQNLNLNYSYSINEIPYDASYKRTITNVTPNLTSGVVYETNWKIPAHNLRLSYDYFLTEKFDVGFTITGYSSNENQFGTTDFEEGENISYDFGREELKKWESSQINLFTKYKFGEDDFVEMSLDILRYENFQNWDGDFSNVIFETPENIYTEKTSPFNIKVFKLDFESKIFSLVDYSGGIKYVKSDFINQNSVLVDYITDDLFTNESRLDEYIFAAYSQFNFDLSKKIKIQSGIRYEFTDSLVDSPSGEIFIDRDYGNFFPSLFLSYKINDYNNLNFSYSKRITRPAFTQMAPLAAFIDLNTAIFGNLSLVPSYSDNIQFDYRFKSLNVSAQYSIEKDIIARFSPTIDTVTNFVTFTPNNFDKRKSFNVIFSYPFNPLNFWNIRFFTTFSSSAIEGSIGDVSIDRRMESARLNMNNDIRISDTTSLQIVGFYQSKQNLNNGGILLPLGKLDISFQKKISDNLNITLNGTNIFNTMGFRPVIDTPELNMMQRGFLNLSKPQAKMTITYNFGNNNIKTKKIRESEEAKRVIIND